MNELIQGEGVNIGGKCLRVSDYEKLGKRAIHMVIDLTAREMHIAWGNPCQNAYHTYHLDE